MLSTNNEGSYYSINQLQTQYYVDNNLGSANVESMMCDIQNPISPAGFLPTPSKTSVYSHAMWYIATPSAPLVKGFFGGCTPLEALLPSTFDCLYDLECIQLLISYFPGLNQLDFNLTNSVLSSKQANITLYDKFLNLFIEEWLTENTLRCPCSTTIIPYETFISLSPILHQVYSSDFVTDRWLSIVKNVADWTSEDWRNRAYSQFSSLSNFCQLVNNIKQMNEELDHFLKSTINAFGSLIDIGHLITQVDQPYMGSRTNLWNALPDLNLVGNIRTNNITNERSLQSPVAIYQMDHVWDSLIHAYIDYIVPGSISGCSTLNSLLFSQLLCFYSEADCFPILMNYIKESFFQNIEYPSWFDVHPLVYDPTLSRYPPNTSISMIIEEMMIEKWNPSYSYNQFYKFAANLNIFPLRYFGSNVDRRIAKYLGKLATRLYIILFIIGLAILTLYTIVRPQIITKTFDKPSFYLYNKLKKEYQDKLKCSCSVIASKYKQFVQIEAIFHQICTSSFTSDQWRINITTGLVPDLTVYEQRDYRRFLSAHLQYLQGLCQFSIQSVNNSIEQFLTSLFITSELLSEKDFHARLHLLIEQSKSSAPKTSTHLFFLIRSINHGNAMVPTYGTNFEYISTWFWNDDYYPYIYNQTNFIERNSSRISIKSLKMGCTPSESLRSSTLECFYDQSSELIIDLCVEQWATVINYSSYYKQCLPLLCSYTYIQKFNILYIITILLGLQAGLTIVLEWISPKLVRIITKLHNNRKKRLSVIEPSRSFNMITIEIYNINVAMDDDYETEENVLLFERTYASLIACIAPGFFGQLLFYPV
ncbi:unnamed protein product [Rotaria sordida]|uniref:Uncharacterized protein n=2 Tax=Rotaria sordida TaxID=392033 RepID=A0A813Z4R0_9BILA|nr:unnamed protein product [Rotaria sordida]